MDELTIVEESATEPITKKGSRWLVTVARPGKGMTGTYSEEALKNSGPIALPAGTKAFFKHAKTEERDPRDQVGVYKDGAFWNEEAGELQAYLTPFPRYAQVLEEAGENIEASLRAAARKRPGTDIVTEFVFQRDNTVDLVAFAGLAGSGLKYQVESLFAAAAADGEHEEEIEENIVSEKLELAVETLTANLTALTAKFDTFVTESLAERQGVADEAAVAAAAEILVAETLSGIAEVEKSINDADIPVIVKEALKDRARKGEDITADLAGAVEIVAETKKELTPSAKNNIRDKVVVVQESLTSDKPNKFRVGGWN